VWFEFTESSSSKRNDGYFVLYSGMRMHSLSVRVREPHDELFGTLGQRRGAWLTRFIAATISHGGRWRRQSDAVNEVVVLVRKVRFVLDGIDPGFLKDGKVSTKCSDVRRKRITCSAYVAAKPFAQKIPNKVQPPLEICVILVHSKRKKHCKGFDT
jgi:hypothetical protein